MRGKYERSDLSDKIEVLLKTGSSLGLKTQNNFLDYLGKNFRLILGISTLYSDREAGKIFLSENICPHLS